MVGNVLASIPLETLDGGQLIGLVAVVGGALYLTIRIIANNARAIAVSKEREQSRREVAAYVAEGSMRPEEAERILAAGIKDEKSCRC